VTNYLKPIEPVDYLVVGHISQDIKPDGVVPGGTAAYSALTAQAFGLRVGILSSYAPDAVLPNLGNIQVINQVSEHSTVFHNQDLPSGRLQHILSRAETLYPNLLPSTWKTAKIIHLGPIANEVDLSFFKAFPDAFVGITPQGWFRAWDQQGKISFTNFIEASHFFQYADAVVLSIEDLDYNENIIAELVYNSRVLVVTEGARGARVYWHGDVRNFRVEEVEEVDSTGAGDIFAAAFFIRLAYTRDPWGSARFAANIATNSVTREGMQSAPTPDEIQDQIIEIIQSD
jgi:hypothetical protein